MINLYISIHEMKGNELREVTPANVMKENNVPISKTVCFTAEDEFHVFKKIREWLDLAENPLKGITNV